MDTLLGIGWWMWLLLNLHLLPRVIRANYIFRVVTKSRSVFGYFAYVINLTSFVACILNHPFQ